MLINMCFKFQCFFVDLLFFFVNLGVTQIGFRVEIFLPCHGACGGMQGC